MANSASFMVKIEASPELVGELKSIIDENPELMKLESSGPAGEPSHLRLGLEEVYTLIAILNGAATFGKLAYGIYKNLSKNKTQRMTLQTPLRTVEILGSDAISVDRISELLESSLRV